jgi:hypothetical protein
VRSSEFRVRGIELWFDSGLGCGESDQARLESAGGFLRKFVAWQELHSEFITRLRRNIWHARENVVYLLPVYPLFA